MLNGNVRNFDPSQGCAFQGDVAIVAMPKSVKFSTATEIRPMGSALILLEGEQTGHHHMVDVMERSVTETPVKPSKPNKTVEGLLANAKDMGPAARFYNDAAAGQELVRAGVLTRADLMIGVLEVTGESVVVRHHEHDGIRLPKGTYYIGRQIESAFNEERVVRD